MEQFGINVRGEPPSPKRRSFLYTGGPSHDHAHRDRRSLLRGAFTVEAALLMPVVLMVILSLLYLCIHVHNRNYLLSYATEQAISGHIQPEPPLLFSTGVSTDRTDGGNMRTVSVRTGTVYYTGRCLYRISKQAGYKKVKPVSYLWKMRAIKDVFGQG